MSERELILRNPDDLNRPLHLLRHPSGSVTLALGDDPITQSRITLHGAALREVIAYMTTPSDDRPATEGRKS